MKTKKILVSALLSLCAVVSSLALDLSTLADASGNLNDVSGITTLNPDSTYVLDRRIYVPDGHKLVIPAGTVIKAVSYPDPADAAALVVTRGGQIFALGTAQKPIVFTHVDDPLDGSFSIENKELWGGVMILGKAQNNILEGDIVPEAGSALLGVADGVGYIEGLPQPDERHHYGATDTLVDGTPVFVNDDNSGVLKYVSIRHGGTEIGEDNEINGLTLASVGSGTTIDHIEVMSNGDDGIECFGGTVNLKHVNIMFCEDDYLDWDQGYIGKVQYFFGLQLPETIITATGEDNDTIRYGDNGMECDGDDGAAARPFLSNPTVYNATIIGNGHDEGLELKERTQGTIGNSILASFGRGVRFTNTPDYPGALSVDCNLFLNNGATVSPSGNLGQLTSDGNLFVTSSSIIDDVLGATISNGLDNFPDKFNAVPAPGTTEIETTCLPDLTDGFFEYAPYKGAFAPGEDAWLIDWTVHDLKGTGVIDCEIDANGDRLVNAIDFNLIIGNYGSSCD